MTEPTQPAPEEQLPEHGNEGDISEELADRTTRSHENDENAEEDKTAGEAGDG